jgi:hypothetical protein
MLVGRYEQVDWDNLKSHQFDGEAPPLSYHLHGSCGTHALAHIMKKDPYRIDKYLPKKVKCWSNTRIVRFLRKNGYTVQPVTIFNVTNREHPNDHISRFHVLLVGQHVLKHEGTWSVVWNNERYHSGYLMELEPLEFINCPIECAYIIHHKRWRNKTGDPQREI